MTDKLKGFLTRHDACREGLSRLAAACAAAADAADAARADAEADAEAEASAAAADAAREAQAKWIRDNFVLNELNIK